MADNALTTPTFFWLSVPGASAIALLYLNHAAALQFLGHPPRSAPALRELRDLDQVMVADLPDGVIVTCHGGPAVRNAFDHALHKAGFAEAPPADFWGLGSRLRRAVADLLHRVQGAWGLELALRTLACPAPVFSSALEQGRYLLDPPRVQLWGPVNAGKSSLLNALCGEHLAAVADEPGLTRDVIEGRFEHMGVVVRVFDAPGEGGPGAIDAAAIALARQWRAQADLVINLTPPGAMAAPDAAREWYIYSRCDENGTAGVSARLPETLEALKSRIVAHFFGELMALADPWLAPPALLDELRCGGDVNQWLDNA